MKRLYFFIFITTFGLSNNANSQYSTIFSFGAFEGGSFPYSSLVSDGTFLYGMTYWDGMYGNGTIFRLKTDGSSFTKIHDFGNIPDGQGPYGSLISDGTFLYGMTTEGGLNYAGTIFKIKPDGTGYLKLLDFGYAATGSGPYGSLFFDGIFLYGMTSAGGANNFGTIFKIMPDGTGFVKLLDFAGSSNGSNPRGTLVSDGTFLYGMTYRGGTNDMGTIFKIMPDGTGYLKLLDFAGASSGSSPLGSLTYDGSFLYGMTKLGGVNNLGTIFKVMTDGSGYLKLLDFAGASNGSNPNYGTLIKNGSFLYGITSTGGVGYIAGGGGGGTIFKIKPDGSGFVKLWDFSSGGEYGYKPFGSIISVGSVLYGMTYYGGMDDAGAIFSFQYCTPLDTTTQIDTSVTQYGTSLMANANPYNANYQWIDCDNGFSIIPGETNQYFMPYLNGNYAVILTQTCTDTSDTSACYNIHDVGINSYSWDVDYFYVYPVPATQTFQIDIPNQWIESRFFITNSMGQLLQQGILETHSTFFNIGNYLPGIYFISIYSSFGEKSIKMVKN